MKFQPPKGTRDVAAEDAIKLQKIIDVVRNVFEKYGFEPLFTPAFESFELLSAKGGLGEGVKDEIYFFEDKSKRQLGLRFDLTMPLARIVTSSNFPLPFKRYQIEKVWRYDNPQAMRYREFWQADIDVVGSKSVLADAECLACVCEIMQKLGFKDFSIRVNSRQLLEKLLEKVVTKDKLVDTFRAIDKWGKIGEAGVRKELVKNGIIPDKVFDVIKISGSNEEIIRTFGRKGRSEGLEELDSLIDYAKTLGFEDKIKIDLSLVRGLEYYTGLVFEVELGAGVSCGGGGRYDNLMKKVGGKDIPATGISLGIDRILEVMKNKNMFKENLKTTKIFVASVNEDLQNRALDLVKFLRENGVPCQIDLMDRDLKKQLEYADKIKSKFVVIVGKEELQRNEYKLRDMQAESEKIVTRDELLKFVEVGG